MRLDRFLSLLGGAALLAAFLLRLAGLLDPGRVFFDAHLYATYVQGLGLAGLAGYPDLVGEYRAYQAGAPGAVAPPTRALFLIAGHSAAMLTGLAPIDALRLVAWLFNLLILPLAYGFARRLTGDPATALVATALFSLLPTQLFMARGALIDGFFAFWATAHLWTLWENLRQPGRRPLLILQILLGALLVLTKETSAFVFAASAILLVANRWLRFGTVTRELWMALVLAGILGLTGLVLLSGGADRVVEVYRLLISKAYTLEYAIRTGDGPWFRYAYDLFAFNPATTLLALGALFGLSGNDRTGCFLALFVLGSMGLMTCLRYGMNLRYGNIWDLPLCVLAAAQIGRLAALAPLQLRAALAGLLLGIALLSSAWLARRLVFERNIGELVAEVYLPALDLVKPRVPRTAPATP